MDDRGLLERGAALAASAAGGATLLGGVVYATQWAVRNQWLDAHPEVGLALGLLVGVGGLVGSEPLWSRDQRAVAAGLSGSGLGIVFFTLYAAHAWYGLLGGPLAAFALAGAAIAGVLQAVRRNSQLMAALGMLGGMATPLLLNDGSGRTGPFLTHLLLMNAAIAAAAGYRRWRVLPWLAIGSTLVLGVAWAITRAGNEGALVTSLSGALLGGGWAWLAADPRVPLSLRWPYWVGATGGLVVTLPFVGGGSGFWVAVAIPLVAISVQTALLQIAGPGLAGTTLRGMSPFVDRDGALGLLATIVGGLSLLVLAARWGTSGHADPQAVIALLVVPLVTSWLARGIAGCGGPLDTRILGLFALAGALGLAWLGGLHELGWVAIVAALAGQWIDWTVTTDEGALRLRRLPDGGPAGAAGVLAAAGCLTFDLGPVGTLASGAVVAALALLPAMVLRPRPVSAVGWLPTLATPVLLVPLGLAWRDAVGTGAAGVIPVALAVVAVGLLAVVRSPLFDATPSERRDALTAHWGIAILFATIAIPMQLAAQWLTIGWAMEGLALTAVGGRMNSRWMSVVGLGLLAAVTVRLTANPAVLDYHHVARPHLLSWVLYGYGLPVGALAMAARVVVVPENWRPEAVRVALQIASIAVAFVGINVFVSHGFAGGETLSLLDTSLTARLFRTLAWTAMGMVLIGRRGPGWRTAIGAALLALGTLKLGLSDVWILDSLPRAIELVGVAGCLFASAALLQLRGRRPAPVASDEQVAV